MFLYVCFYSRHVDSCVRMCKKKRLCFQAFFFFLLHFIYKSALSKGNKLSPLWSCQRIEENQKKSKCSVQSLQFVAVWWCQTKTPDSVFTEICSQYIFLISILPEKHHWNLSICLCFVFFFLGFGTEYFLVLIQYTVTCVPVMAALWLFGTKSNLFVSF